MCFLKHSPRSRLIKLCVCTCDSSWELLPAGECLVVFIWSYCLNFLRLSLSCHMNDFLSNIILFSDKFQVGFQIQAFFI